MKERAMETALSCIHWSDAAGNPAGGITEGKGFTIAWQNGPLGRGSERVQPNGAFVEEIIAAAIDRLSYYQSSPFACEYNERAIEYLEKAIKALRARTEDREDRMVEGTHQL